MLGLLLLIGGCAAQLIGKVKTNVMLDFPIKVDGTTLATSLTIDANWRWVHYPNGYVNCFDGAWTCGDKCDECLLEGVDSADWNAPYGVKVTGTSARLNYVTGSNYGSRLFLVNKDKYYKFNLLDKQITFTADVSELPCGTNGAVYTVEMPEVPVGAGAPYGVGYGDAQCPRDLKYIFGKANVKKFGSCSPEMDLLESNKFATAMTPHPCNFNGTKSCVTPLECGENEFRYSGPCDKDGADFNPYRSGDKTFYGPGPGFKVDTTKPFDVITQFITSGGALSRIQRFYRQGGPLIDGGFIDDASVEKRKLEFGEQNHIKKLGGMRSMGESLARGHVLVLSIWDDDTANMLWLDSTYPKGGTAKGDLRGPCPQNSGVPATVRKESPGSYVVYSNVRIDSLSSLPTVSPTVRPTVSPTVSPSVRPTVRPTVSPTVSPTVRPTVRPTVSPTCPPCPPCPGTSGGTLQKYSQCGGIGWTGKTDCVAGTSCTKINDYYSQCL